MYGRQQGTTVKFPHRRSFQGSGFIQCSGCKKWYTQLGISRHWDFCPSVEVEAKRYWRTGGWLTKVTDFDPTVAKIQQHGDSVTVLASMTNHRRLTMRTFAWKFEGTNNLCEDCLSFAPLTKKDLEEAHATDGVAVECEGNFQDGFKELGDTK